MNDKIRIYRQNWLKLVERLKGQVPKQDLWYKPKGKRDPGRRNSQKPEQVISLILEFDKLSHQTFLILLLLFQSYYYFLMVNYHF